MANGRVKEYKVTYEDGTSSLQPFTAAQAADLGTVLEADGLGIDAAFRLVEQWNAKAKLQRNELRYSILFSSLQVTVAQDRPAQQQQKRSASSRP